MNRNILAPLGLLLILLSLIWLTSIERAAKEKESKQYQDEAYAISEHHAVEIKP